MKALTFTYDDGQYEDKRLCELFSRYGMKCTFNLIGSQLKEACEIGKDERRLSIEDMLELYSCHEVAMHTFEHPYLTKLERPDIEKQVLLDREKLTEVFGVEPLGLAYPCGAYNQTVLDVLREFDVKYARTNLSTYNFELPEKLLEWSFTCRHREPQLMELAKAFIELKPDRPQLFSVMGHSYEFKMEEDWAVMEEFCKLMASRDDIYYCTNAEALL